MKEKTQEIIEKRIRKIHKDVEKKRIHTEMVYLKTLKAILKNIKLNSTFVEGTLLEIQGRYNKNNECPVTIISVNGKELGLNLKRVDIKSLSKLFIEDGFNFFEENFGGNGAFKFSKYITIDLLENTLKNETTGKQKVK